MATLILLSWLPGAARPVTGVGGLVEHAAAYAGTAVLLAFGYPDRRLRVVALLAALGAVLEVGQLWIPGRGPAIADAAASAAGACVGTVSAVIAGRMLRAGA